MMDDYNRCGCSASFPSIELLAEHLAEIRTTSKVAKCLAILIPDAGFARFQAASEPSRSRRTTNFGVTMRNFASEFIRHSEENHRAKSGRKAAYMKETFHDVSRHVTTQLYTAKASFTERLIFDSTSESKKRTWDVAGIDEGEESNARKGEAIALTTEDSQCRRVISSLQEANYPNAKPNASALRSLPMDTGFLSVAIAPEVTGPNGNNDTLDTTSAQLICHNPMQEGVVGDPYNARLLQIVSSVPFTGDFDWGESEGWGVPGSVA
uniref:Uncharacterized protein n=1 Tax=Bionectria ochroleuca TaxID=29856 RepID=A0A0B7KT18_BIOOC